MQRAGIRVTVAGVAIDVPFGSFANGDFMQYDAASGTFKGAAVSGGTGDVTGPGASVNNRLVTFSGTTGKIIQDGTTIVATGGGMIGSGTFQAGAFLTGGTATAALFSGPATAARETAGPTDLAWAAVANGNLIQRNGTTLVGIANTALNPGGSISLFSGTYVAFDRPVWSGTQWLPKYTSIAELTSNQTPASATLTDITGLTFSLPRAGTYRIDCSLVTSQSTAVAIAFGINVSANFTRCAIGVSNPTNVTAANVGSQVANNTATASGTRAVTTNLPVTLSGSVTVSGAATLTIRAQRVSGTLTILAGSAAQVNEQ
jgi:hypothetical protein